MHAGLGISSAVVGIVLTAVLIANDVLGRLSGEPASSAEAALGEEGVFIDKAVVATVAVFLGLLAAAGIAGGVVGRFEEERGASVSIGAGVVGAGLLLYGVTS